MRKFVLMFALVAILAAPGLSICINNLCRCSGVWVFSPTACTANVPTYCTIGWYTPDGVNRLPSHFTRVDVYAVSSSSCTMSCTATPSVGITTDDPQTWVPLFHNNYATACSGADYDPCNPPGGGGGGGDPGNQS